MVDERERGKQKETPLMSSGRREEGGALGRFGEGKSYEYRES